MEEKTLSKDEFMAKWRAHKKEKERIRRELWQRHNDERLRRVIKKRRTK
jgi:hypothetical protein